MSYLASASFGGSNKLHLLGGTITIDEARAPRFTANLRIRNPDPLTEHGAWEMLDPTAPPVIRLYVTVTLYDTTRTFNLKLREVNHDAVSGESTLVAMSDEGTLMDYLNSGYTDNLAAYDNPVGFLGGPSGILSQVVLLPAGVGGVTGPAGGSPTIQPLFTSTNLVKNPTALNHSGTWEATAAGATATLSRATAVTSPAGTSITTCARNTTSVAASTALALRQSGHPVTEGEWYAFSGWGRFDAGASAVTRDIRAQVQWIDSNGNQIGEVFSAAISSTDPGTGFTPWVRPSVVAQAPLGAATANVAIRADGGSFAIGTRFDATGYLFEAAYAVEGYWDGNTADTAGVDYMWTGNAGETTSRRTVAADQEIPADVLVWESGTSAWDYAQTLTQPYGLWLWCDEDQDFHLEYAATYTAPGGTVVVFPADVLRHGQRISVDNDWFDSAVYRYRWRTGSGRMRQMLDIAKPPGSHLTRYFDIERPFPGRGAAARAVQAAADRAKETIVTVPCRLDVDVSRPITVTLPDGSGTAGKIRRVQWDLTTGETTLTVRSA